MTTRIAVVLISSTVLVSCCCLEEISIKPQVNGIDVKNGALASAFIETVFKFQECCPSKEQEQLALAIQTQLGNVFVELLKFRDTTKPSPADLDKAIDEYNKLAKVAEDTIKNVILVCRAKKENKPALVQHLTPGQPVNFDKLMQQVMTEAQNALNVIQQKVTTGLI
jgi:hypothetical protein